MTFTKTKKGVLVHWDEQYSLISWPEWHWIIANMKE